MKKIHFFTAVLLFVFFSQVPSAFAQNLARGPYLQSQGPTSIIICWRTDAPTDSRVNYGLTFGSASYTAEDANSTTEHRVKLTGLAPRTKYHYIIGSTTQSLRGPDTLMYFTTAPDPAIPTPVRLWAIGDFGHGNDGERLVRDSYLNFAAADRPADLWLWLGDNVYQDGTDEEFQTKVFDSINGFHHVFMNLPFASTSGNHDYNSICPWQPALCTIDPELHTGPYLDLIAPPTQGELGGVPSGRKIFYSFDYGDIHIISLNSELGSLTAGYNWIGILNNDTAFTSPMLDWLKADLAATTKKWKIAIWHQCPYSGQENLTEETSVQQFCVATRHHFNPILERYGVDLVLTGHDHNYQRSYLINGHYLGKDSFTPAMKINGTSGNDLLGEAYVKYTDGPLAGVGTVYVVEGNCSNANAYSPIEHPAIYWGQACDTCLGSLVVDIDGDRLDARYLTAYGEILDRFTIKKQSSTGIKNEQQVFEDVDVYPNPARAGQTTVSYTLLKKGMVNIDVLDLNEKLVYSHSVGNLEPGKYHETLNLEKARLAKGTYLIRLDFGGVSKYKRVVKID